MTMKIIKPRIDNFNILEHGGERYYPVYKDDAVVEVPDGKGKTFSAEGWNFIRDWRVFNGDREASIPGAMGVTEQERKGPRFSLWQNNCYIHKANDKLYGGILDLKNEFLDRPALLLMTGYSVKSILKKVKKYKKKGWVIIGSAAMLEYLPDGVIDYVIHICYSKPHYLPWWDSNKHFKKTECVFMGYSTPSVPMRFDKKRVFFNSRNYREFPYYEPDKYGTLESFQHVGFTMINFADHLGCNPINFAGMDCCFYEGHEHVYNKLDWNQYVTKYPKQPFIVPDINASWTLTNTLLCNMAKSIEITAYMLKDYQVKIVNLLGTGLVGSMYEDSVIERGIA